MKKIKLLSVCCFLIAFLVAILSCKENVVYLDDESQGEKYKLLFTELDFGNLILKTIWSDGSDEKKLSDFDKCYMPQWSYDGKYILYLKESYPKSIWMMDSTGNHHKKITEGNQFICSPFEEKICFIREEYSDSGFVGWTIYSIKFDGSELTRLTEMDYQKTSLCWSSDPNHIYYKLHDNWNGTFQIMYKLNILNYSKEELFNGYDFAHISDCSKDGKFFVFSANHSNVYKYNLSSKSIEQLTSSGSRDEFAMISPNNDEIVFATGREIYSQVYLMNANGSDQRNISQSKYGASFPKYSPDGSMIAYVSFEDEKSFEITIFSSKNSKRNKLVEVDYFMYEWCPVN